ncbi:MAG: hypothetical protein EBU80_04955 [Chitinophagia bacterium]|nr:hypothetical protein [Chitinophagia bacterium]
MKKCLILLALLGIFDAVRGQKIYTSSSVLSSGQWIKFSIESPGVYKISALDLKNGGFSLPISSPQLRLYGNGGMVLPESNASTTVDDLKENALDMYDGGDGTFDGNDYLLFYAPGPHQWRRDTSTSGYLFQKNPYSDRAFYFLQIGNTGGKRLTDKTALPANGQLTTMFDEHIHHELDSINFLKSGKEWYGEDFSNQSGRIAARDFNLNMNGAVAGELFQLRSEVVGSSAAQPNKISVSVNGKKVAEHITDPISGSLISPVASISQLTAKEVLTGSGLVINYQHSGGSVNAISWLNWFDIFFKRKLDLQGLSQLNIRVNESLKRPYSFQLSNASTSMMVWDVSDPSSPQKIKTSASGSTISFTDTSSNLNEYIVFDPAKTLSPTIIGKISNQNLHELKPADLFIVTEKSLMAQANRLRDFHLQHDGMSSLVVDIDQIYNEFSSGVPDPTSVRNFLKMFYDRSSVGSSPRPKYLLLFGSASYLIKEKNAKKNSLVPSYQTNNSIDPLLSYVTDDYLGLLDDTDDINDSKNIALLDIAIGRIPVRNEEQAKKSVDKILRYHNPSSIGAWRNNLTLVADDEDYNLHLDDAELHSALLERAAPQLRENKIYLDAFKQESNTGGSRYPAVNEAVQKDIREGTLIWNYSGHGNNTRLAYEVVLDKELLSQWNNEDKLPFFITATCDFAPFDDQSQFSLGEDLFIGRNTGAIGLVTTTRLVFASSNRVMNNNFLSALTSRNQQHVYPTLGQASKDAKNYTYQNNSDFINVRKFTLLGDPAMKLAMPDHLVKTTSIQLEGAGKNADTLKALSTYTVNGEVKAPDGTMLTNFNGFVYPTLYDKQSLVKTLANDADSKAVDFSAYNNVLYKGKVKVSAGRFSFGFTLPKDINYKYGTGKLIYYAENGQIDASGADQNFVIGGLGSTSSNDVTGPDMLVYLDTITFKNGDELSENPVLHLQLSDLSGINLSQSSIGHQIVAVLDDNYAQSIVLNDYYVPDLNGKGTIRYPFFNLSEGRHKLMIRAWDVFNNSSMKVVEFFVKKSDELLIQSFVNFPNPFYDRTTLKAALSLPTLGYQLEFSIFTLDGKWVKRFQQEINQTGALIITYDWDGTNTQGVSMQKGMYIARIVLKSKDGKNISKLLKVIKR